MEHVVGCASSRDNTLVITLASRLIPRVVSLLVVLLQGAGCDVLLRARAFAHPSPSLGCAASSCPYKLVSSNTRTCAGLVVLRLRGGFRGLLDPGPPQRRFREDEPFPDSYNPEEEDSTSSSRHPQDQMLESVRRAAAEMEEEGLEEARLEAEQASLRRKLPGYDSEAPSTTDSASETVNPMDDKALVDPREAMYTKFRKEADNSTTFAEFCRQRVRRKIEAHPEIEHQIFPDGYPGKQVDVENAADWGSTPDCSDNVLHGMDDEEESRYSPRCDSGELRLEKFYPDESWELSDSQVRDSHELNYMDSYREARRLWLVNNTEYDKRDCKWIARLPQYYGEDAAKKAEAVLKEYEQDGEECRRTGEGGGGGASGGLPKDLSKDRLNKRVRDPKELNRQWTEIAMSAGPEFTQRKEGAPWPRIAEDDESMPL